MIHPDLNYRLVKRVQEERLIAARQRWLLRESRLAHASLWRRGRVLAGGFLVSLGQRLLPCDLTLPEGAR